MNIFLTGFMGSGKTTIGKRMAERIGFDFVDTDEWIERREGKTVAQIFADSGEETFRKMERDTLEEMRRRDFTVISTGGGMPCFDNNMDVMLAIGKVAYLYATPQTLAKRLIRSQAERPLIKDKSLEELQQYIAAKLEEREPFYRKADIIVSTENFSMERLLQLLNLMK
jgi:shikimate kinase